MKAKVTQVKVSTRIKKEKQLWTKETATQFINKNIKNIHKGLKFWAAADYLKKVHNIIIDELK